MSPESDAQSSMNMMPQTLAAKLKVVATNASRSPEVRAAAYIGLGMTLRNDRRKKEARRLKRYEPSDRQEHGRSLSRELENYRQALNLEESATTHCYLAECLLEKEWANQAGFHVKQALLLAPDHVLAHRLLASPTLR